MNAINEDITANLPEINSGTAPLWQQINSNSLKNEHNF